MRSLFLLFALCLNSLGTVESIAQAELKTVKKGALQIGLELKVNSDLSVFIFRRCDKDRGAFKFIQGEMEGTEQLGVELVEKGRRLPAEGVLLKVVGGEFTVSFWMDKTAAQTIYSALGQDKIFVGLAHAKVPAFLLQTTATESIGEIEFKTSLEGLLCSDGTVPNRGAANQPKSSFEDL